MTIHAHISEDIIYSFWRGIPPIGGEIWKDVVAPFGTTQEYQISNMGRVVSLPRMRESRHTGHYNLWKGKLLKPSPQKSGHERISIRYHNRSHSLHIHNLVMWAFIGAQKPGTHIIHADGDLSNNLLKNLSYGSHYFDSKARIRSAVKDNGIVIEERLQNRIEGAIDGTEDPIAVLNEIRHLVLEHRTSK